MSKKAWFITHDDYIDRRIFFFVDVMREQGYEVKLFPSQYFNILCSKDSAYVKRPVNERVVKEYNIPAHFISDRDRKIFRTIIQEEEQYWKENNQWTKIILALNNKKNNYEIQIYEKYYSVILHHKEYILCYNSLTESYSRIMRTTHTIDLINCEKVILEVLINGVSEEGYGEIEIKQEKNEYHESCIYAHVKNTNYLYVYNLVKETLTEISLLLCKNKVDVIKGKKYDFKNFRELIYDYSYIFFRVLQELKKEKPDIVYVADLPTLPIGIMLKKAIGCKLMIDCHEWWYKQTVLWEEKEKKKIALVDQYEKELYPQCDLCITVGENLANRMEKYIGCPFKVIYSCMSQGLSKHSNVDKRFLIEKYNLRQDSKIAIFQGGMSSFRNLENLARATRYLEEDCYLLLLTTGAFQEEFKKILNQEGNPERVIWGGWISQDELLNYTKSVDLGIIPYVAVNDYAECFVPNKLMEYFEVKVPIFYDSSMYELNLVAGGNHVGYGANLKDAEEFGKKLNSLLHNNIQLNELKRNYETCSDKFGYMSQREVFLELFSKYILEK